MKELVHVPIADRSYILLLFFQTVGLVNYAQFSPYKYYSQILSKVAIMFKSTYYSQL